MRFAPPALPSIDQLIRTTDAALRTVFAPHRASRPCPQPAAMDQPPEALSDADRALSGALMRVNHVGEVCAQALYTAQALVTRDDALRAHLEAAARDETDHLAWTEQRLAELGDRPSRLNPLWYAGAFAIGALAGRVAGDNVSLGFVVETEHQVERHLESHLDRLPARDTASRSIVEQMKLDEARHALEAERRGALPLPSPVRGAMQLAARLMTITAHRI